MLLEPTKNKLKQWRVIEKSVNKCNFFSQMFWIITKWMKITEKQICEDQIVTFKQSHILLYQGLLFLTRSTCVIVDARSHTCKSHDFIPRYDIILCALSKVFEKVMYNRLLHFINELNILYKFQFGFRKDCSTHMALITLMDKLITALENGEFTIGVFLDFSKAFDTINHKILFDKLYHYAIRGVALTWCKSYLSNRYQYVTYNGVKSSQQIIRCGVPQGSILGPLLFLIYINDLPMVCKHARAIMFADDTNIFLSNSNIDDLQDLVNEELSHLAAWLKINKLSLNLKKTHYMVFTNKRSPASTIKLEINNERIVETCKTKFLGVIIDNKLTWKEHINYISGKIARGIGIITKARKYLNKESLLSLYYSFIYPYFTYCNQVWGNTCKTYLEKIILQQKRAIRMIAGVPRFHSTDLLFTELKLLKFIHINKYLIGRLMFRIYNHELQNLFGDFFTVNRELHGHNTRQALHYHIPLFKTNLGKSCLRYYGAMIWNKIMSLKIPTTTNEFLFSRTLKANITLGLL